MKKICAILLIIALLIIFPLSALADDGNDTSPQPTQTDTASVSSINFSIDNANVYQGMNKAYKDGYTPTVGRGVATIVLPLVSSGQIAGSVITATPNLGDPSSSPFVFKNYQKNVALGNNAVNGGKTVKSYLVRFDLPLASGRTNGVYAVSIDIQAQASDGTAIDQTFTSYITITDGKDANPPTQAPEKPSSQPKVIVSSYTVNPVPAVAGGEFTANVTLKNTSTTKAVQNMAVTVSCDSPGFTLENDSSTFFISKLGKGSTTDLELKYKTSLDIVPQQYNLVLAIAYDNTEGTSLTSQGTIQVTVSQPLSVQMETPQIPAQVNAGDTLPLSIQVMNMGRSKIYNVRCTLNAPGLLPTATAFIGDMEAGTAAQGQMNVFVGTKDMSKGYTGSGKYGPTSGKLTLTYNDEAGKEYTQNADISTTINTPPVPTAAPDQDVKPEMASQWWISVVIGAAIVAGLITIIVVRDKKKAKQNEDEDI